jgi:hypothetical protein
LGVTRCFSIRWHWSEKKEEDRITDLYNKLKIIENHIPKGFVPRKYSKVKKKFA